MKANFKWTATSWILLCAVIASSVFLALKPWKRDTNSNEPSLTAIPPQPESSDPEVEKPQNPYDFTSSHMDHYAAETSPARNDVQAVSLMLESAFLIMKDQMPSFSGNQELVTILQGKNPSGMKFLSSSFPYIDQEGQLLDRWRNPLFFHRISGSIIDVRSAGPDGILWNGDDVHTGRELETSEMSPK